MTLSTGVYTLDTWEANGGTCYMSANGPFTIHSIRYVLIRVHAAR